MSLIFVYGTLKSGHSLNCLLNECRYVGEAKTKPSYLMHSMGKYPAMVEAQDGMEIEGEVWEVLPKALSCMDVVEGVDLGFFVRQSVNLQPPFDMQIVEAYVFADSVTGFPVCGTCWTDW